MAKDKWKALIAEMAVMLVMQADKIRAMDAANQARAHWLGRLLEKEEDFCENKNNMPASQRELLDSLFYPDLTDHLGTGHGLIIELSDDKYIQQRGKIMELVEGILRDKK